MPHAEFTVTTNDLLTLSGQEWTPDGGIKAIVCLVHGIGEHSDRYRHVATALTESGYALVALDLRGHGKSEGKRGHSPTFDTFLSDINQLLATVRKRYPNYPCFLYGHSLGGSLVIHYLIKKQPKLAGAIVTSPMLQLAFNPPSWKMKLLRWMNRLNIQISVARGVDSKNLSRDKSVVESFDADPLVHDRITPRLTIEMLQAGQWNMQHAAKLSIPMLLMHGNADTMTSVDASRLFAEAAGSDCQLKIWEECYHELHNEPEKEQVLKHMLNWLNTYS